MTQRSPFLIALAVAAACAATSCSSATTANPAADDSDINASVQRLVTAVNARDVNGIMAYYAPDESLLVFDATLPRQYVGATAFRKDWEGFLAGFPSTIHAELSDWKSEADQNLAYGHGIFHVTGPDKDGKPIDMTVRITDVFKRMNGKWLAVHEHVSWPVDIATGKADMMSKP
jgi:ketosteroid isomerase-like protein